MIDVYTLFDNFVAASTFKGILQSFQHICTALDLDPTDAPNVYKSLRQLSDWKSQKLWKLLDKKYEQAEYKQQKAGDRLNVLIIGAGPCGLRMAIECALLGSRVVVVEQRDKFSRNNVLHLWEYVIHDLKSLGAKLFYPKFCTGSIEHISIRQLQCILLKVALVLGVQVFEGVSYVELDLPKKQPDGSVLGYRAILEPRDHLLSSYEFDVLIGADGKRNTVRGFPREEMRGKLAIGITANFVNRKTHAEERVPEISGVAYIFNQAFFKEMYATTGVDLENIVYYKDETHYFVMCAKKQSLIEQGVIVKDFDDVSSLLDPENIDQDQLCRYAASAANFATNGKLPALDYATNHRGRPDISMFDFTSLFSSKCSCRLLERNNKNLLLGIVGDSLHEPFWPTGSGCARGFLGVMDTAWLIREYGLNKRGPLEILAERESIYRLLAQVTKDNLHKQMAKYTIDPRTRYVSLEMALRLEDVEEHVDSDNPRLVDIKLPLTLNNTSNVHEHADRLKYALWRFCSSALAPYKLKLVNMDTSWRDGRALAGLLAKFRPEALDYFEAIAEENVLRRLQKVFDKISESLDVPAPCFSHKWEELEENKKIAYIGRVVGALRVDPDRVAKVLITPRSAASKRKPGSLRVDASKAKKSEPIQKLSEAISGLYGNGTPNNNLMPPARPRASSEILEQLPEEAAGRPRSSTEIVSDFTRELDRKAVEFKKEDYESSSQRIVGKLERRELDSMEEKLTKNLGGRLSEQPNSLSSMDEKIVRVQAAEARKEALSGFSKEYEKERFKDIDSALQKSEDAQKRRELAGVSALSRWREQLAAVKGPLEKTDDEPRPLSENDTSLAGSSTTTASSTSGSAEGALNRWRRELARTEVEAQSEVKSTPPPAPPKTVTVEGRTPSGGVVIRPVAPVQPKRQAFSMPNVESVYDSVNPRQHKCQICEKIVYLAERVQVESMYLHKQCFKCAFCGLPLRLGEGSQDKDLERHYRNKFFCKTHLRLSLKDKLVRIEKLEKKALGKRNSQDEGNSSDSSKENVDPPTLIPLVSKTASGSTIVSTLGMPSEPVIRVSNNRSKTKATLTFHNPETLRDQTLQRLMDSPLRRTLTSPVGNEVKDETPERAEFNAQEGASRKDSTSIRPADRAIPIHLSDSEDDDEGEDEARAAAAGDSSPDEGADSASKSSGSAGGSEQLNDSLSDDEDELLQEEDLEELERTVLDATVDNPDAINEELAVSFLEKINKRRSVAWGPASSLVTPPRSKSPSQERFFTPSTSIHNRMRPSMQKARSEDVPEEYQTPREDVRQRKLAEIELMRSAARERAKKKSDEELGLGSRSPSLAADRRSVPVESLLMRGDEPSASLPLQTNRSSTVSPPRERFTLASVASTPKRGVEPVKVRAWSLIEPRKEEGILENETRAPPALPSTKPPEVTAVPQIPQSQPGLLARLFSPDLSAKRRIISTNPETSSSSAPYRNDVLNTVPSHSSPSACTSRDSTLGGASLSLSSQSTHDSDASTSEKLQCDSQRERSLRGKTTIWNKLKSKSRRSPQDSPLTASASVTGTDSPRVDGLVSVSLNSDLPCAAVAPSPRAPVEVVPQFSLRDGDVLAGVSAISATVSSPVIMTDRNIRLIQKKAEQFRRRHDEDRRRSAQDIQRGLQETEIRMEQVQRRGVDVEQRLRKDPCNIGLLSEWTSLVQERDILVLKEDDLRLRVKEMDLEERYKKLNGRLRDLSAVLSDDARAKLLRDMLAVIDEKKVVQQKIEESRMQWRQPRDVSKQLENASHDFRKCEAVFVESVC